MNRQGTGFNKLQFLGRHRRSQVVIREQKAVVGGRGGGAAVQKPGRAVKGVGVQQLHRLAVFLGELIHQGNHLCLKLGQNLVCSRHIQVLNAPILNFVFPIWKK